MSADAIQGPRQLYSDQLHASKYRLSGETFRDAMTRVAGALQDDKAHYHKFRGTLLDMRFLPAGRVQSAMGAPKAVTAFNCFVGGVIPDSFVTCDNPEQSSIMARAAEGAQTMRMGGGLGNDFSTLRPAGALIEKIQSMSTGPLKFMGIFNSVGDATSSTGERRGAQMGVLRIDHPDIEAFITAKHDNTTLKRFNISVGVTDEFMEHLETGRPFPLRFRGVVYREVDPLALWDLLMRSTWDWAEPGVIFIDRVNQMNNLYYCETIAATNPCFSGDTLVWTAKGPRTFLDLAESGETVKVLTQLDNGRLVYRNMRNPRMTRRKTKMVEVALRSTGTKRRKSEVTYTRCTPNHVFYLRDGTGVEAKDLVEGMSLGSAYRHLANSKGYLKIANGHGSILEHHIPFEGVEGLGSVYDVHHRDDVKDNNDPENLELMLSSEHDALKMLGDKNPMVRFPERHYALGGDAIAGDKNPRYRSELSTDKMQELFAAGVGVTEIARRLGCSKATVSARLGLLAPRAGSRNARLGLNHRVVGVRELEVEEDVYCGTVEETAKFFIVVGDGHGVLVSNCGEQPLPPHGACLLGSYNLVRYVRRHTDGSRYIDYDALADDIPAVTRAMDNIIDRTGYPLPEQEAEAKAKRRMGMGVTGLANALEACGHPYGTRGFIEEEHRILAHLTRHTYLASVALAEEKGAFPLYDRELYGRGKFITTLDDDVQDRIDRSGLRNSHLISYAPTGTISMCADNVSSSIEPTYQWKSERPVELPGGTVMMDEYDYGFREFQVRGRRAGNGEVSAAEHVDVLVAAQSHCDSAVSKTVNCDGSMAWDDFKNIYVDAYKRGAKGTTTFNVDGKRFGLFTMKKEADDIPFPDKSEGRMYAPTAETISDLACTFDPATGRRTCE